MGATPAQLAALLTILDLLAESAGDAAPVSVIERLSATKEALLAEMPDYEEI